MNANHLQPVSKSLRGRWVIATVSVALIGAAVSLAEESGTSKATGAKTIRDVLELEASGKLRDRRAELQSLSAGKNPTELAQWSMGNLKWGKKWVPFEAIVADSDYQERLADYRRIREAIEKELSEEPTAEFHRRLAYWCRDHKLPEQEWFHWMKVVECDPSDAAAHARLGDELIHGTWYRGEELEAAKVKSTIISKQLAKWLPQLKPVLAAHRSEAPARRATVAHELKDLAHPDAVPAIQVALVTADEPLALQLIDLLGDIGTPDAALVLTRVALIDTYSASGDAAIKRLSKLPREYYVPAILGALSSPITQEIALLQGNNGELMLQQILFRETQSQRSVQQLLKTVQIESLHAHITITRVFSILLETSWNNEHVDLQPRNPNLPPSIEEQLVRSAAETALQDQGRLQADQVAAANALTEDLNRRIYHVLSSTTQTELPQEPNAWWQWWYDQNELYVPQKTNYVEYQFDNQVLPAISQSISGTGMQYSCLVAGTVVQTAEGLRPVEEIQPGDMVLSQHPESGELAYKPVLHTTVRPPAPIVSIETDEHVIRATGGHLFWVAGQGWKRARTLAPDMALHDVYGVTPIRSVKAETEKTPAYNLIVADFHTYFVGAERVLSYDNTPLRPTAIKVPGLAVK